MTFQAIRLFKTETGQETRFLDLTDADLMDGDVDVRVEYSTVNFKDGLALTGKLPDAISTAHAMAIGTAGYTAMLCVMGLEREGVTPDKGDIVVTGAAGGVG